MNECAFVLGERVRERKRERKRKKTQGPILQTILIHDEDFFTRSTKFWSRSLRVFDEIVSRLEEFSGNLFKADFSLSHSFGTLKNPSSISNY